MFNKEADISGSNRIQPRRWLIIENNAGLQGDSPGQAHPFLHAPGQIGGHEIFYAIEPYKMKFFFHNPVNFLLRQFRMHPEPKGHIFLHIHGIKKSRILKYKSHVPSFFIEFFLRKPGHVLSVHHDLPGRGPQEPDNKFQQRGFPAARSSQNNHGLSVPYSETHVIQYPSRTECLVHMPDIYHRTPQKRMDDKR